MSMIILAIIIYLIGIIINCYFLYPVLIKEYNTEEMITIGSFSGYILVCLTSWMFTILALTAWICCALYTFFSKPLIKKK